ncbi:Fic family protein [Salicibibacter cibarius]|uniref:Fic family protein n=1 Tax=Salicibibacter cibarius TaxID=2743000 RepID=A0A7T7CAI3_9BACI|nr:Fic family protein [Salicibibacter cibarius]QQK74927.1 Fic family protein [Salicibibacter cibarius]
MHLSEDYYNDLLVRMAHHSSAIENNTISLPESVSILLYDTVPAKKSLREVFEILNHRKAFEILLDHVKQTEDYVSIVCELHAKLLDRLHHERGSFKKAENAILGADFQPTPPSQVYLAMRQWHDNIVYRENNASSAQEIIDIAASSHLQFERIHPFADGNGRVGRMFIIFLLLKYDLPPIVIEKSDKERYIFLLANQDEEGLASLFSEKITIEKDKQKKFANKE